MDNAHLNEIASSEVIRKRLAKWMALQCFRNSRLEDFHAGKTGDYDDVKVVSPYGEIPWPKLSRLCDDEMRTLMIDAVNRCYALLGELFSPAAGGTIIARLKQRDELPRWNDPQEPSP